MSRIKKTIQESEKNKTKETQKKDNQLFIPVFNLKGEKEKDEVINKNIFSVKVKPETLAKAVRVYLFNQRQGTVSTKTRKEVTGSTRKIYRQKGTGRARHGDIKAPIFVGGGVSHGPKPRDFSLKMNKKEKRKALFGALTLRFKENDLFLLKVDLKKVKPKTKELVSFLDKMKIEKGKVLFVFAKLEKNPLVLGLRNLKNVDFAQASNLNIFQVLKYQKIIFVNDGLTVFTNHYYG